MRRSVLLMFVVVFTICVCKASVRAESSPVSLGQPTEIPQEEKTPVINKTNKDGELKHTVAARQPDNTKKEDTTPASTTQENEELQHDDAESEPPLVKDPLQPYNRAIFVFNDKAHHYFIKPIYTGYNSMVPEKARVSVKNFLQTSKCLFVFSIVFSRVNSKAQAQSWGVSLLIAPLEWQDSSIRQNQNSIWKDKREILVRLLPNTR